MKNDNPIYNKIKEILANRLACAVASIQMSQAEVARKCGLSRQTLYKYINGVITAPVDVTVMIAELSKTNVHYLLGKDIVNPQPCDDAISRDAALEKMADYAASGYADSAEDFEEYSKIICQLPPVTPQQKYGKWIEHPEIETSAPEYLMFYECSECGNKPCFCKSDIHKKRFCSNCGARMVEPQERSE